MSDLPGLALALAAQACLLTAWWWQTPQADGDRRMMADTLAESGKMIVLGALIAGFAVGLRTQTLWLTAPLLAVVLIDRIGRGVAGAIMGATMTFTIGALAWAVPLLVASGGLQAYLAALGTQAGEDFASGEMLYTNPAPRLIALALVHTFVDPWDSVPLAAVVLALAAAGALVLLVRDRRTLFLIAGMAVPYLIFHLLFQDTAFTRYSLPFVPVVAFLAMRGVAAASSRAVIPVAAVLSLWAVAIVTPDAGRIRTRAGTGGARGGGDECRSRQRRLPRRSPCTRLSAARWRRRRCACNRCCRRRQGASGWNWRRSGRRDTPARCGSWRIRAAPISR